MFEDEYRIHETDEQRERERQILLAFTRAFGLTFRRTPRLSCYDADIIGSRVIALAEAKWRANVYGTYPSNRTYIIDVKKLEKIWALAESRGLDTLVIVEWVDDIRWALVTREANYRVTMKASRKDRNELPDRVYHIPIADFYKL